MNIRKYLLEIVVFASGATVMIFEIAWSRIYAPYFWTSTYVWTSLIGVILGSLSVWYYYGWKLADKKTSLPQLSKIIFWASLLMLVVTICKDFLLSIFAWADLNKNFLIVTSSIILFWPVSILLWIVSPYCVRLKLSVVKTSWETIWRMYALWTFGSIVGTYAAGFYLIPTFGTNSIMIWIIISLCLLSIFIESSSKKFLYAKILFLMLMCVWLYGFDNYKKVQAANWIIDIDTQYARVKVFDYMPRFENREMRTLQINTENHSSVYLDTLEPANEYINYYDLASVYNPDFESVLMLGWAGYTYPRKFLQTYPWKSIDVVEIDPGVTDIAREYFWLVDDPLLNIFHEDARVFLNNNEKKYDAILGDAFNSFYSIPYQLTTVEAVKENYDSLADDWVVVLNIISAIEWRKWKFLQSTYKTYSKYFPYIDIYTTSGWYDGTSLTNLILVASKQEPNINDGNLSAELQGYLRNKWTKKIPQEIEILTDNYAPVDSYLKEAF